MLVQILSAFGLLAFSVTVHAFVLTHLFARVNASPVLTSPRFWPFTWLLIRVACWAVLAHLIEISAWAAFYAWQQIMPDIESSFYFSVVTYTTVGYGDLVPPHQWRLLAGVEGLTGILMCGWSTAFFFAIVNRVYGAPANAPRNPGGSDSS